MLYSDLTAIQDMIGLSYKKNNNQEFWTEPQVYMADAGEWEHIKKLEDREVSLDSFRKGE